MFSVCHFPGLVVLSWKQEKLCLNCMSLPWSCSSFLETRKVVSMEDQKSIVGMCQKMVTLVKGNCMSLPWSCSSFLETRKVVSMKNQKSLVD